MAYDGQTDRNGLTRGREHTDKVNSNDEKALEKSVIFNHQKELHQGESSKWEMKVIKRFPKKPLDRQIFESIRIASRPVNESLNSKIEGAKSELIKHTFISDNNKEIQDKLTTKKALIEIKDKRANNAITNIDE